MKADRHLVTLSQVRWALPVAGYDPQTLSQAVAALPDWAAQAEKEEGSQGFASQQFRIGLRAVLEADGIVGCNPLVAPSPCDAGV